MDQSQVDVERLFRDGYHGGYSRGLAIVFPQTEPFNPPPEMPTEEHFLAYVDFQEESIPPKFRIFKQKLERWAGFGDYDFEPKRREPPPSVNGARLDLCQETDPQRAFRQGCFRGVFRCFDDIYGSLIPSGRAQYLQKVAAWADGVGDDPMPDYYSPKSLW